MKKMIQKVSKFGYMLLCCRWIVVTSSIFLTSYYCSSPSCTGKLHLLSNNSAIGRIYLLQCLMPCFRCGICSYCGADGDGVIKYTVVLFCMSMMNRARILTAKVKNANCSTRAKTDSTSTPWKRCCCYILKEWAKNTTRAKTESTSTPWMCWIHCATNCGKCDTM